MIRDIQKAYRALPKSPTAEKQKIRFIALKGKMIKDIVEFYDTNMTIKSGNLCASMVRHIQLAMVDADDFSFDVVVQG